MLMQKYESRYDFEDTPVYFNAPQDALKRRDIRALNDELSQKCEEEATKLYRLARNMEKHNCKTEIVIKCREEARALHMNHFPWQVLNPFNVWTYAFQF